MGGDQVELSTNSTNAKVFKSHGSAVKRIVTEASPFYFMTCSEDGDVRQWDIRQPESAYPRCRNVFYPSSSLATMDDAPPPLISYRDFNIDLYTISCSPSQPHYIAPGGTHLHCFLHDRRMAGRDKLRERGGLHAASSSSESATDTMMEATQCVQKFAPHGQPAMHRSQGSQITACKISNANPNELVVSWSGDHIYSFDITRNERGAAQKAFKTDGSSEGKKRKRHAGSPGGASQEAELRAQSKSRTASAEPSTQPQTEKVSLLIKLRSGESIEVPIEEDDEDLSTPTGEEQAHSLRIAQGTIGIKRQMFLYQTNESGPVAYDRDERLADREDAMVKIVCEAAGVFEIIDDAISHWAYPTTTLVSQISFQRKLQDDRAKTWRFIQAAGTLARVLLKLSPQNNDKDLPKSLDYFDFIRFAPREAARPLEKHEHFGYDFVKVVLLWLDSGIGAVLNGFTGDPSAMKHYPRRQPVQKDADADSIETELMPYLRRLATERPVVEVDRDSQGAEHVLFESEIAAVSALERAMQVPFADLQGDDAPSAVDEMDELSQSRETALEFWGMKVCRSLLRTAAIDIDFACVDGAFDGVAASALERDLSHRADDITHQGSSSMFVDEQDEENPLSPFTGYIPARSDPEHADDDDDAFEDDELSSENEREEEEDDEDEDDDDGAWPGTRQVVHARRRAGKAVPCSTHTKFYRGHCNVETTKDVNFYGLQDEYIVSGSDCGNMFVWDKKTANLVTVLQGDGEVVNVIQGNAYTSL